MLAGRVGPRPLDLTEVAPLRERAGHGRAAPCTGTSLRLYRGILDGLRAAGRAGGPIASVGVDSWGVDFGLLDADGRLLANPVHYRDGRTDGVMARTLAEVPPEELYRRTGLQFLPFNTVFQLLAAAGTRRVRDGGRRCCSSPT